MTHMIKIRRSSAHSAHLSLEIAKVGVEAQACFPGLSVSTCTGTNL